MNDTTVADLYDTNLTEQQNRTPLNQRKSVYQTTTADESALADTISMAVETVSQEQAEPPPVAEYIDVDRLETLLDSSRDVDSGAVWFFYAGYKVEIQWSGELRLWPRIDH